MRIWVDADSCPAPAREILFKASIRTRVPVTLVSDRLQPVPKIAWITSIKVDRGMDAADQHLVDASAPGDLVITHDVPLAAELVKKGVEVIGPRGEPFTKERIGERLAVRDLHTELRASGVMTGGPKPYDNHAKQAFGNALDRWLTLALKRAPKE